MENNDNFLALHDKGYWATSDRCYVSRNLSKFDVKTLVLKRQCTKCVE